jgi:hypothetical protein
VSTQGRPPSFFDDADAETPVTGTTPTPVDPPWLAIARGELGTRELVNGKANPKIAEYFQATGFKGGDAQDAWCSAFVNACMKCVCVFSRPPNPGNGHVAFFISREKNWIHVLSGNQNNMVCVKPYAADRLFDSGMRWPEGVP